MLGPYDHFSADHSLLVKSDCSFVPLPSMHAAVYLPGPASHCIGYTANLQNLPLESESTLFCIISKLSKQELEELASSINEMANATEGSDTSDKHTHTKASGSEQSEDEVQYRSAPTYKEFRNKVSPFSKGAQDANSTTLLTTNNTISTTSDALVLVGQKLCTTGSTLASISNVLAATSKELTTTSEARAGMRNQLDNVSKRLTFPRSVNLVLPDNIDTRHPYRLGWPLLPSLPVHTSREQVPKILSTSSLHLEAFKRILMEHEIAVHDLEVLHRFNPSTQIGKETLTLCIRSEFEVPNKTTEEKSVTLSVQSENGLTEQSGEKDQRGTNENVAKVDKIHDEWTPVLLALRAYIQTHSLSLKIEIIDRRIFKGMYTLPVLVYDPAAATVSKRKHGIKKILNECANESGEEWTSLEFFYRGVGCARHLCKPTVLVGVPHPERAVWWEGVVPRIKEKVQWEMEVEVIWREVVKC
jgi:hypothetical protein